MNALIIEQLDPIREAVERGDKTIIVRLPAKYLILLRGEAQIEFNEFVHRLFAKMKEFGYMSRSWRDDWEREQVFHFELEGNENAERQEN